MPPTEDLLLQAKALISQAAQDQSLPLPKKQCLHVAVLGIDRVIDYLAEQREWQTLRAKTTR
jgi:hypothetical protein